jgi:hypothetical protein
MITNDPETSFAHITHHQAISNLYHLTVIPTGYWGPHHSGLSLCLNGQSISPETRTYGDVQGTFHASSILLLERQPGIGHRHMVGNIYEGVALGCRASDVGG